MKKCITCGREKPVTDFGKDSHRKDRLKPICKECRKQEKPRKEYKQQWYQENKVHHLENHREYVKTNEAKIKLYKKQWAEEHKKELARKNRERYIEKRDEILKQQREWYSKNKNKQEFKIKNNERNKKWHNSHPWVRAWRNTLNNALKRLKSSKINTTERMMGYNDLTLKSYVESQWLPGMNWDNYGEWHIDHIQPVFTFSSDTPISVVNALSNLRPLWATTREIDGVIYEGNLNRKKK